MHFLGTHVVVEEQQLTCSLVDVRMILVSEEKVCNLEYHSVLRIGVGGC